MSLALCLIANHIPDIQLAEHLILSHSLVYCCALLQWNNGICNTNHIASRKFTIIEFKSYDGLWYSQFIAYICEYGDAVSSSSYLWLPHTGITLQVHIYFSADTQAKSDQFYCSMVICVLTLSQLN